MYVGKTLFAQVMEFVPWTSFARIVQSHGGNAGVRALSCAEQFRAMAFAQLTWRESLRDIEVSLSANSTKLYALGFRSASGVRRWPTRTSRAIGASGRTLLPCSSGVPASSTRASRWASS